jgi:flagellar biosynthesis/type III secretory pathway protein FliH
MKKFLIYVICCAWLPAVACSSNTHTEQADPPVTTVPPAIEEEPQTIGQRIDTANAALQRKTAELKQDMNEAADTAKKGIKQATEAVKDGTRQAVEEVKAAGREVKKEVKATTAKAAGTVEEKAKAVKEDMKR